MQELRTVDKEYSEIQEFCALGSELCTPIWRCRFHSNLRSSGPMRRGTKWSRGLPGSEGEWYGGSGQDNSLPPPGDGLYGLASIHWGAKGFPLNKKRRRSISEDSDAPRLHTSIALVPLKFSRHAEDLLIKLQRSLTSEDRSKKRPP